MSACMCVCMCTCTTSAYPVSSLYQSCCLCCRQTDRSVTHDLYQSSCLCCRQTDKLQRDIWPVSVLLFLLQDSLLCLPWHCSMEQVRTGTSPNLTSLSQVMQMIKWQKSVSSPSFTFPHPYATPSLPTCCRVQEMQKLKGYLNKQASQAVLVG